MALLLASAHKMKINEILNEEAVNFEKFLEELTLNEHFGNLSSLSKTMQYGLYHTDKFLQNGYKKLSISVGASSSLTSDEPVANAKKTAEMFANDKQLAAVVIYDEASKKQLAILSVILTYERQNFRHAFKSTKRYVKTVIDFDEISKASPEDHAPSEKHQKLASFIYDIAQKLDMRRAPDGGNSYAAITPIENSSKIEDMLSKYSRWVFKALKEFDLNTKNLRIMKIMTDEDRATARKERQVAKGGRIPGGGLSQGVHDEFGEHAKRALQSRLEKFKSDKLLSQGEHFTWENLLDRIGEKGYLDEIVIDGFLYNYAENYANFDLMRDRQKFGKDHRPYDNSYIRYRLNDNQEKYKNLKREYRTELNKYDYLIGDDDAWEKQEKKLRTKFGLPPKDLKIHLELKGGHIVPASVEQDYRF